MQKTQGGLWNTTKPVVSADTVNLLKVMMEESKLTNFQQRTLNNSLKSGNSLPIKCGPSFSTVEKKKAPPKQVSKIVDPRTYKNGIRNLESIVDSGAYEKSDYRPTNKKSITDKDKDRLVKIMTFGNDESKWPKPPARVETPESDPNEADVDRFDELQSEIKDRISFLEAMTQLGKRKEYESIILTEISQKIREMEMLDKSRTTELNELIRLKEKAFQ